MKHPIITFVALVLTFTTVSDIHAQKDVKSEIMEANERFMTLFAAGDATAFVEGMYTSDAQIFPPNSPMVTGKDNLVGMWSGMMEAGITPKVTTTVANAYGKTAVEEGHVDIYAGSEIVDKVNFIVIWKKDKEGWKMHRDIWNSSMPAK